MIKISAIVAIGLFAAAPANSEGIYLLGNGNEKCIEWNEARTSPVSDSDVHEQHRRLDWILGYLGGSAQWRDKQLLRGVTPGDVEVMVNGYCALNPNATIYWAADAVADALVEAATPVS